MADIGTTTERKGITASLDFGVKTDESGVPLGLVQSPARNQPYFGAVQRQFTSAFEELSGALAVQSKKVERENTLRGQMMQMEGKTKQEVIDAGGSPATQRGYMQMEIATTGAKWYSDMEAAIRRGDYNEVSPEQFRENFVDTYKNLLTGNEYSDNLVTTLASDYAPKLAASHTLAFSNAARVRATNSYHDLILQAGLNHDPALETIMGDKQIWGEAGLNDADHKEAVTNAVVSSFNRGITAPGKILGLYGERRTNESVYGDALLFENFSPAQQEKMLRAKEQYLTAQKEAWSAGKQREVNLVMNKLADGSIGPMEAFAAIDNLGLSLGMQKTAYASVQTAVQADIKAERARREALTPELLTLVDDFYTNFKETAGLGDMSSVLPEYLAGLGVSPDNMVPAVKHLTELWQKDAARVTELPDELDKQLSPEEYTEYQNILSTLSDAPGSLRSAEDRLANLLLGKNEIVAQNARESFYEAAGVYPSQRPLSASEEVAVIRIRGAMETAIRQGSDPAEALIAAQAELNMLADSADMSPLRKQHLMDVLETPTQELRRRLLNKVNGAAAAQAVRAHNIQVARNALTTNTVYNLTSEQKQIAFELKRQEIAELTQRQLLETESSDIVMNGETLASATAFNYGQELGRMSPLSIDTAAQNSIQSLGIEPPMGVDAEGNKVFLDGGTWYNNYMMYRGVRKIDKDLAIKYAGPQAAFLEMIIERDDAFLTTENAAAMAFADRTQAVSKSPEELLERTKSKEVKAELNKQLRNGIEDLIPGAWTRFFSDSLEAYIPGVNKNNFERAMNDPRIMGMVQREFDEIVRRIEPGASDKQASKAAVAKVLSSLSYVNGNMLRGTESNNFNLAADMGIKTMVGPLTAHAALIKYMDEMYPVDYATAQQFSSTPPYELPITGQDATPLATEVTGTSWESMSTYITYNQGTRTLSVYPTSIDRYGQPIYDQGIHIPVQKIGQYWEAAEEQRYKEARAKAGIGFGRQMRDVIGFINRIETQEE